jgi:serine/threonine-protein kinase
MSLLPTIAIDRRGRAARSPREVGTTHLASVGYRRLAAIAGILAGVTAVTDLLWLLDAITGQARNGWDLVGDTILLVGALGLMIACRRSLFPARAYTSVAIVTELLVSIDLGAGLMGWQFRAGDELGRVIRPDVAPPFELGAGEVPWVGVWVLLFATIVPLRPWQHLIGGLLSVGTLLFWPALSVAVQGMPEAFVPKKGEITLVVTAWLFVRGLLMVGIAYFAARSVYGLRRELAEAKRVGSYELREKLGQGGMGEVWRADHDMLARPAAIKLIRAGSSGQPPGDEAIQRFEREVQAAAGLQSPHTIQIYDYGVTSDGTFYYVMELLDGMDLEETVRRYGPMPWPRTVHVLTQVCRSLAEAHEGGLIHRDIKPANVFLCRLGLDVDHVKVLDFGLVKAATRAPTRADLTERGVFVGTPAFAAPEAATGDATRVDPRADLYSLGCVAYWLLTGKPPFEAPTPLEVLVLHAREPARAPSAGTVRGIPEALDRIVLECLEKDPGARPPSAEALARALATLGAEAGWSRDEARAWWRQHRPRRRGEEAVV